MSEYGIRERRETEKKKKKREDEGKERGRN